MSAGLPVTGFCGSDEGYTAKSDENSNFSNFTKSNVTLLIADQLIQYKLYLLCVYI